MYSILTTRFIADLRRMDERERSESDLQHTHGSLRFGCRAQYGHALESLGVIVTCSEEDPNPVT